MYIKFKILQLVSFKNHIMKNRSMSLDQKVNPNFYSYQANHWTSLL